MAHPRRIRLGDALALLPDALDEGAVDCAVVVYHSHVTYQFSDAMRTRLNEILATSSRKRPDYRVSIEWDGAFLKTTEGNYPVNVGLYNGIDDAHLRTVAFADPHGAWIEWKAP
jgi:hypothetical protein